MESTAQGIEAKVRALTEPAVARDGYELVDIEYRRESAGWTLTLFIDKQGGVGLADCQRVSQVVGTVLDVEDPIPHRYSLQVSSPGLNRPLKNQSDFLASKGRLVKIVTREPLSGQRRFSGRLVDVMNRVEAPEAAIAMDMAGPPAVRLVDDSGVEHVLPLRVIQRAHIVHEWPDTGKRPGKSAGRKK